ncbi:MAG: carboxypeptidase-like regulatory domain-containing protein [Flavobacteriales bacterium]
MTRIFLTLSTAFLFFIYPFSSNAQVKIEGVVRDANSGKPIPFVIVTVDDSQTGDVTTERGEFEVLVSNLPAAITFRMLGYEKTIIRVTKDKRLDVRMVESVVEMNTVEIRASQLERVAGNESRSIWDYAWCDGNLLICDYGTSLKSASLFLLDDQEDTLGFVRTPDKPVDLFNDCMGNAHFQGTDSTWQILFQHEGLKFLPGESNYLVDNILRKCKSADEKRLFFEIPQGSQLFKESSSESFVFKSSNDEICYFYGSRDGSKLIFLTRISDEVAQKLKDAEVQRDSTMHSMMHGESYSSSMASKHFFYTTLVKEVYAPIVTLNETTYIMDYVHGNLVVFDSAMNVARVDTIRFDFDPRIPHRCIADEEHKSLYVLNESSGITTISLIDIQSCSLVKNWSIPHTYPDKITVRNGYVYYIHRDPQNRLNRFLSRLKLE